MKKLYQLPNKWLTASELPYDEHLDDVKMHIYSACRGIQDLFNEDHSYLDNHASLVSELLQAEHRFYQLSQPLKQLSKQEQALQNSMQEVLSIFLSGQDEHESGHNEIPRSPTEEVFAELITIYNRILAVLPKSV